jgi:Amt family ammonium transporter
MSDQLEMGHVEWPATPSASTETTYDALTTLFVLFCAFLVFFMQCGFAFFSSGFVRAKNSLTLLAEGLTDLCVGCLAFFIGGYAIMFSYGQERWWKAFFLVEANSPISEVPTLVFWLYHAMFCTATTTIASGAMAERIKFSSYLCLSTIVSLVIYPVVGMWTWGGGWLAREGFIDLAGSTQVHMVGGMIALVGCLFLGPRKKKYGAHGRLRIIPGHSLPLATLGAFILWFGWFGFNLGSLMSVKDPEMMGLVTVNTLMAGCCGCLAAMFFSWIRYSKPDVSMAINGALAGLVSITAGCHVMSTMEAMIVGGIGGLLVLYGVPLLDRLKVDDPVGAIVVHGMGGLWGTLAIGLFANADLVLRVGGSSAGLFHGGGPSLLAIQLTGAICVALFVGIFVSAVMWVIHYTLGLRVSVNSEERGLDLDEFGVESYNDFQIFSH